MSGDDAAIQRWLTLLRDGTDAERIEARRQLAAVFEQRGMLDEAVDLLVANIRRGERHADIFRWLARLYRAQGDEDLAMQAAVEAAKHLPPLPVLPPPPPPPPPVQWPAPAPASPVPVRGPAQRGSGGSDLTHGCLIVVGLAVACLVAAFVFIGPLKPATSVVARSGKSDIVLGRRPIDFGTRGQAQELLALMDRQPRLAGYSVAYETDVDGVAFGCDFTKDVIIRVHTTRDGHGTGERWSGSIEYRLRSAASGGSLNDTPNGKSFGTFESF